VGRSIPEASGAAAREQAAGAFVGVVEGFHGGFEAFDGKLPIRAEQLNLPCAVGNASLLFFHRCLARHLVSNHLNWNK
jgi:hypothetical protein